MARLAQKLVSAGQSFHQRRSVRKGGGVGEETGKVHIWEFSSTQVPYSRRPEEDLAFERLLPLCGSPIDSCD